jgi:hypothetical protein
VNRCIELLGRPAPRTALTRLADMNEPAPRNDITHPTLSALATLNAENALPIEPMEPTLPTDPIDKHEERLQILSTESSDPIDHRDVIVDSLPPHHARSESGH